MIENKSPCEKLKGKMILREKADTGMSIPKSKIPFLVEAQQDQVQLVLHRIKKSEKEDTMEANFVRELAQILDIEMVLKSLPSLEEPKVEEKVPEEAIGGSEKSFEGDGAGNQGDDGEDAYG